MAEEEEVQMEEDVALHAVEYRKFKLMEKVQVSEMTVKFRFALNKAFVREWGCLLFFLCAIGYCAARSACDVSDRKKW